MRNPSLKNFSKKLVSTIQLFNYKMLSKCDEEMSLGALEERVSEIKEISQELQDH